jgi:flagellar hook-associated protein 2
VQGGYQVAVTQLATSAQRTFTYTPPGQADTVTIDGKDVPVAAGASIQTFVSSINNNSNLDVWATATDSGTVVLSNRATGKQTGSYIQVSESNTPASLTEQTSLAQAGQNALYTVNSVSGSSASNTVASAIPGVSLSLNGLTTGGAPVTVDVSSPAANTGNIQSAVSQFIKDYNSALTQIQTQLSQKPTSSDPTQGTLYGDSELKDLLSRMRTAMYTGGSGLPHGMSSMLDIGVSTGASNGAGPSQNTLSGQLTLDATALTSAIQSNPTGVEALMGSWANSFSTIVNSAAGGGGTISIRIQDDTHHSSNLASQITNLQAANTLRQKALVQQFSKMEAALSASQSTSTWLMSQINALPTIK